MEELVERCARLEVHQAEITACARTPGDHGGVVETVQEFGTTTPDLLPMLDWCRRSRKPPAERTRVQVIHQSRVHVIPQF